MWSPSPSWQPYFISNEISESGFERQIHFPDSPRPDVLQVIQVYEIERVGIGEREFDRQTKLLINGSEAVVIDDIDNKPRPPHEIFWFSRVQEIDGSVLAYLCARGECKTVIDSALIWDGRTVSSAGVITPHICLIKPAPPPPDEEPIDPIIIDRPSLSALIQAHNDYRAARGLPELQPDDTLMQAAAAHCNWMIETNTTGHTGRGGSSPMDRALAAGFTGTAVGENLAYGQPTILEVMDAWHNSPGHQANIVHPNWTHIGVARVACDPETHQMCLPGSYWWCVKFGTIPGGGG